MAEYLMPKLGHLQEVGTVVEWRKHPGDIIKKGEILIVIETEKTTVEVEATFDGVLQTVLTLAGETMPVGATIATYLELSG
jgi:pyruvate/2-oxoglutarate dehydrogenase complex dihydrolipoamide acyltransferase (E2) component